MNETTHNLQGYPSLQNLQTPRLGVRIARVLIASLFIFTVIMFLPWQQNINGYGQVTAFNPRNRPQTIQNSIPGRILKWYIVEGQTVNQGDTLLHIGEVKDEYFDPKLAERLQTQIKAKEDYITATQDQIDLAGRQLEFLNQGLLLSLQKAQNKLKQAQNKIYIDSANLAAERIQFELAQRQEQRYQELYKSNGLISLTDLEKRRQALQEKKAKLIYSENTLLNTRQEYINAQIEIGSIRAEYQDKISKTAGERAYKQATLAEAEKELSMLINKASNVRVRQAQYFVIAPQKGFVSKALKAGLGEIIKEGEPVVTIVPEISDKAVELFIRPMDLPLVHIGQEVRLQFDGYPSLAFSGWPSASVGTFGGKVKVVVRVTNGQGTYRLLVIPDTSNGLERWPDALQLGSSANGWAMLGTVQIWYELWRQFNGFPPNPNLTQDKEGDKDKADQKK